MDPMISLGQKNTLAEYMILLDADNRPPMLDKDLMIRTKKYTELSATEKIQDDCDMKATNIILQGLPADIYSLVNHHRVAKDLRERVQLLMQGTSLTKQERECKLYDAFDKFTHIKRASLHTYYLRFTQLINDMNIYKMNMEQFQVSTKFLNNLLPEWSKFVTDVKLVKDLHTSNFDQLHAYLEQHELHANEVYSSFVVPVFSPGDDPIACLNKAMAFLTIVASSRFPTTNNQLRTSFNPRNQATIQDGGGVTMQQVQGRQGQNYSGTTYKSNATSSRGNNTSGQTRVVKCITAKWKGHMARYALSISDQGKECLHDPGIQQTDKAVLMANISNYGYDIISEVIAIIGTGCSHRDYLRNHTQEQANTLWEIVEQAKAKQPLDRELDFACKYATRIQELLVYVQDTCPNAITPSTKKVAVTPMNNVKKVRFVEPLTSSSNIKQVESSNTSDSNTPVLSSTGVKCSTSNCGSKPLGNKKNARISQTPSRNKKNKHSLSNANSEILCATCNKSMFDGVHDKCLLDLVQNGNNHTKSAKKHKKQNIWKPTGSSKMAKIVESKNANHSEPNHTWGSNATDIPLSSSLVMTSCPDCTMISGLRMFETHDRESLSAHELYNGTEFVNQTLREFYENVGISHQTSVARTPQQNSVVERRNRTLVEAARTMLIFSKAPLFLWAEAINIACYTQNRSLIRLRYNKTPYELMQDKKPDLSFLYVFGSLCYPTNDHEDLGKFDAKADIGIFVGYAPAKKAFRIYNRKDWIISETIHVTFDEILTAMASEQFSLGPGLHFMTPGFEESPKTPTFHDDPLNESPNEDSTSQRSSSNVRQIHTPSRTPCRWTKDIPIVKRIGDPSYSWIYKRKQLETVPCGVICLMIFLTSVRTKELQASIDRTVIG
ncbi:retrovirus-related pol polyprotein from transposon TNT 1-94 [Tanacetum coccineum]